MKLLEGKTALITGASRGIGKAIALRYAQEGCNVAFSDLVRNEAMEETEKELLSYGIQAKGYASNAASFESSNELVQSVVADFGRIDILVNNAGITKDGALKRMTEEQWVTGIRCLHCIWRFVWWNPCFPIWKRTAA